VGEDLEDRVLDAITLLDFASSASALRLYVVGVQTYKSGERDPLLCDFRGVPLVDVDTFLKSVDFEEIGEVGNQAVFPFKHEIASLGAGPIVTVFTNPIEQVGLPAPCPDFSLVSEASAVKGYLVTIGTEEMPDIFKMVFNIMGYTTMTGASPVRTDYASAMAMRMEKKRKLLED
jgi:hypothetical protein